jgi:TolB-like protein/Tfp pilus assembly protein PilF
VLPFENLSGTADADYLSDGLTDSLIFRFSQLPGLKVSPTSSVMRYKGKGAEVSEIAKALDVDGVLSGRLMRIGDSLGISVQLIDARNGKIVWAEQYDRKMADLLATQREIAATLTQKMQLKLADDERGTAKKYTISNEAYQLYLKGRFHWAKRKKDDMLIAIDSFKQAIAIDPNFALAYVGVAEVYNSMGKNPDIPPKEAIPLAKAAALRALELDPTLAEAHSALGDSLAVGDWDWAASEREFKKAIELDPNISYIHVAYSGSYLTAAAGRTDEAVAETARALELEPVSLINNALHVTSLINARRYDEALVQARKAYELDHDFPLARHWLGMALSATGKYDEAIALGREVPPDSPILPIGLFIRGYAHARAGDRAAAERLVVQMNEAARTHYVRPYYIACIWAALGEKDKAFAELERSFAEKDCYIPRMQIDPFLDPLRDDPRFNELLARLGLRK